MPNRRPDRVRDRFSWMLRAFTLIRAALNVGDQRSQKDRQMFQLDVISEIKGKQEINLYARLNVHSAR